MKTIKLTLLSFMIAITALTSHAFAKDMELPKPSDSGATLQSALQNRASTRAYMPKAISDQALSNILWAAYGENRGKGKYVVPKAAVNMSVYVLKKDGVYLYAPNKHSLKQVSTMNILDKTGLPNVMLSALDTVLVYATDATVKTEKYAYIMVGSMSQDVALYAAANGLGSMIRWVGDDLAKAMDLPKGLSLPLIQTIGYKK